MEAKYDFTRKFRDQVLRCSSCGFCRARCPIFGLTKRPALNARGKMLVLKEVMDGTIELTDELIDTLFQCTTCASCSEQCPSGVNVPEIIKQVIDLSKTGPLVTIYETEDEAIKKVTE